MLLFDAIRFCSDGRIDYDDRQWHTENANGDDCDALSKQRPHYAVRSPLSESIGLSKGSHLILVSVCTSSISISFFVSCSKLFSDYRIRSDHNEDNTLDVLINWLASSANAYHNINIEYDKTKKRRESETSQTHWPTERHMDLIRLKEEALEYARSSWADYVFVR